MVSPRRSSNVQPGTLLSTFNDPNDNANH